jgi:CheY-like chemotaxis protein
MPKKILLIEEEEIISNFLQNKLAKNGYEVLVANDSQEGLEKMEGIRPDLVLLDVVMPAISGFGVMEEMAKNDKLKNIPVIVISNSGMPEEINQARALGARDFVTKTDFDPQTIISKIIRQIGK